MSDDEADPELLELLRQSLGLSKPRSDEISSDTGVLKDAEFIYDNAIDVSIDMWSTKSAAASLYKSMQDRGYSTQAWIQQELHPSKEQGFFDIDIVNFVFTMDLLNFSFWSDLPDAQRYQVEYREKRWTGYTSLLACLRRALDDGIPITTPLLWNEGACSDETLRHVFRSATSEEISLLQERIALLRGTGQLLHESFGSTDSNDEALGNAEMTLQQHEGTTNALSADSPGWTQGGRNDNAGAGSREGVTTGGDAESGDVHVQNPRDEVSIIQDTPADPTADSKNLDLDNSNDTTSKEIDKPSKPDMSVTRLIEKADQSAGKLVNLLVKHFPGFRDETNFDGRRVRFLKRAQIFVADLWAAFNGTGYGKFHDIGHLTMFADYRVPQMLHSLGVLVYSPPLDNTIRTLKEIPPGHSWEVQLRGCSIWAIELIRSEIARQHPDATNVNAVLIDFMLYDLAKEKEALGRRQYPHHRTRSINY